VHAVVSIRRLSSTLMDWSLIRGGLLSGGDWR
jgi:hypothetical protein